MKKIILCLATFFLIACGDVGSNPETTNTCSDKVLEYRDINNSEYSKYADAWMVGACKQWIGNDCAEYNNSYKLVINDCNVNITCKTIPAIRIDLGYGDVVKMPIENGFNENEIRHINGFLKAHAGSFIADTTYEEHCTKEN
jgi:hypothetical protein